MTHSGTQAKLDAFLDGELPSEERREVESHLADCAECRRECETWRRITAAILRPPEIAPDEAFVRRVMTHIPEPEPSPTPWFPPWLTPALGLAAAGLVIILAWSGPEPVSAEAVLLEDWAESGAIAALAPRAPDADDVLGAVMEGK